MKILFFGHIDSKKPTIDQDIEFSLRKLGHEVVSFDDRKLDMKTFKRMMDEAQKVDLFFYTTGGIILENMGQYQITLDSLDRIKVILSTLKCKKVLWFPFQVMGFFNQFLVEIIPYTTLVFLNDGTWVRRHKYDNVFELHLGLGEKDMELSDKKPTKSMAFVGTIYANRERFLSDLKKKYRDKLKILNNVYGKRFKDLCASTKIIISPTTPYDDFCWSDRIYRVLGSRGFLIHPRFYGLNDEFTEGKHYIAYSTWEELTDAIEHFLSRKHQRERDDISQKGYEKALSYVYSERLKFIFGKL